MQNRSKHLSAFLVSITLYAHGALLDPLWAQTGSSARCSGYGDLQSVSLTDWESGLGSWTAGTHDIANPDTFNTPDWAAVGALPDNRAGMAAFVSNVDSGDCASEDESGVLNLDSPVVTIPNDAAVPRISIDHWYQTEYGWDGGNWKVSVNGGPFIPVPASAIEVRPYNAVLFEAVDEFGLAYNTNPLADQEAYTGPEGDEPSGAWGQSVINLLGIAAAGDTVTLRLDFGIDGCGGDTGWYVDEVEFYHCSAELPPSDCGNSVLDSGEQCDDGNDFSGDGCSNTCQIEADWTCTDPTPAGSIDDSGFEAGTPNDFWDEVSNNFIGTPICEQAVCGRGGGSGPSEGDFWVWLGGISNGTQEGSVSQSVGLPVGKAFLTFDLEVSACDSSSDYVEILVDGNREFVVDGSSPLCGTSGYSGQSVDLSAYADGGNHVLMFHSETFATNGGVSNFFIDQVDLPPIGSECTQLNAPVLTLGNQVVNDNGGTALASAWTLTATGPTPFSGTGPSVTSGAGFSAGTYDLSQSAGPAGFMASAWACEGGTQVDNDTVTLQAGQQATCTITLDDIRPELTLFKTVINDNGGVSVPADWTLHADGPSGFSGPGTGVSSGESFQAGVYTLSESGGPSGYTAGPWACDGGNQETATTVTLAVGEAATCTLTNDDILAEAQPINVGHSGAWFNPETSGQGVLIDVEPVSQFMFLSWYTYTGANSANPSQQQWFTAQGNYSGSSAVLGLYETLGGQFDDPQEVITTKVGEVTVTFSDCGNGQMAFEFDTGLQDVIPMQRLIPGSDDVCENLAGIATEAVDINVGMDGAWFDPNTSGQGFFIDAHPAAADEDNYIFVSWFTFGDQTASGQRWLTAQGGFAGSTSDIEVFETSGGSFNDPTAPENVKIGTMSLDFSDCNSARITYSLDSDSLQGEISVTRALPDSEALCEGVNGTR